MSGHSGALEAVDRILNRGGEPEAVVRAVLAALHERAFAWVGVAFAGEGELRAGPEAGTRPARPRLTAPVVWRGRQIAELQAEPQSPGQQSNGAQNGPASADDRALLERVALLISPQLS